MTALEQQIFGTKNTSDLPISLRNQLSFLRFSKATKEMISLFKIKSTLTTEEILVGIFRKYGRQQTRVWVASTAYNLKKKGVLKNPERGAYELVKNIEDL